MNRGSVIQKDAERLKKELQERLQPYFDRLAYIKSMKPMRILMIEGRVEYDYGPDTEEEKRIKEIIDYEIQRTQAPGSRFSTL